MNWEGLNIRNKLLTNCMLAIFIIHLCKQLARRVKVHETSYHSKSSDNAGERS